MIFSQKSTRTVHLLDKTDKEHHAKSMNFISNPIPGHERKFLKRGIAQKRIALPFSTLEE
jgi:hypothetical protein